MRLESLQDLLLPQSDSHCSSPRTVDETAEMRAVHLRGDRLMRVFSLVHLLIALALAPFYGTWLMALAVGIMATGIVWATTLISPGTFLTRCMGGVALQCFVILHIYQMHGLAEMHFFFFTAFTAMIVYQDWLAMWPGTLLIIGQHTAFAYLTNSGSSLYFFEQSYIPWLKLSLHFGIASAHVAVCGLWAHLLQKQTIHDLRQRAALLESQRELASQLEVSERQQAILRKQEERWTLVLQGNRDGVWDWDARTNSVYFSPRWKEMLGYADHEIANNTEEWPRLVHPDDLARVQKALADHLKSKSGRYSLEYRMRTRQGDWRWVLARAQDLRNADGEIVRMVGSHSDITDQKRAEQALEESETRYALALRGANDGLWDWNLRTESVYYSDRWKAMLGCEPDDIGSSIEEWFGRIHQQDVERVHHQLDSHLNGSTTEFESEHRLQRRDGTYLWVRCRGMLARDADGKPVRIAGSLMDITETKVLDSLTGLANRLMFVDRLRAALELYRQHPENVFAVLFIDLDRFKLVNDSLGHLAGDELLTVVADRLVHTVREQDHSGHSSCDVVARLGGDEFAILLTTSHLVHGIPAIAERLLAALQEPAAIAGREVYVSASIGIAVPQASYSSPEELLRDADTAMYRAKAQGRSQYTIFDDEMRADVVRRLELETELRHGIEQGQLEVYYQPEICLSDVRTIGFEALVRWHHPVRGIISPEQFISLAEETGLIVPLGQFVLKAACQQIATWRAALPDAVPMSVSVNVSSRQLNRTVDLPSQVREALAESGLDARYLKLEVTESILIDGTEEAIDILKELKAIGVGLKLDDFGTGYSSLSYLQRLPVDTLKIDRSFLQGALKGSGDSWGMVRSIITMAKTLQLDVVAEGVETPEQVAELQKLGCRYAQGYYFSEPLRSDTATDLVRTRLQELLRERQVSPTMDPDPSMEEDLRRLVLATSEAGPSYASDEQQV